MSKRRKLFGKKRAEQRAARQEVLEEIQHNPIGAFGLYHVLDDAGLLSDAAKKELAPLMERIAPRLSLPEKDLKITLPMAFEPITDIEQDTLTSVIGQALREFAETLPKLDDPLLMAELIGLNNMLVRHLEHTASIAYEVELEEVLLPLLHRCGKKQPFYRSDRTPNARSGDFFHLTKLNRSKQKFIRQFIVERDAQEGEIVQIDEVWDKGYARAKLLGRATQYSRSWKFDYLNQTLPDNAFRTVIHKDEGVLYRLDSRYESAIFAFIECYYAHVADRSADPYTYRPIGPRGDFGDGGAKTDH